MIKYVDEMLGALALVKTEMERRNKNSMTAKDVMKNVTKVGNCYYHYNDESFKVPYVRINKDGSYKVVLCVKFCKPGRERKIAGNYTKESILKELENGFNTVKIRGGFITVKGKRVDIKA